MATQLGKTWTKLGNHRELRGITRLCFRIVILFPTF